ncbi:MAG: hypothetical protein M3P93_04130 [Actinomycetota bacterium]|nr:hypothetical protein [Actinomycetota bacterium]
MTVTTITSATNPTRSAPALGRLVPATVAGAALTTGLALADATVRATGGTPAWDDVTGAAPAVAGAMSVHALTYALFATVLVVAASPIDAGRRSVRIVRRLLAGSLAVLAGGFASLTAIHSARATAPVAVEAVTGISFVLTFVLAAALGVALLRRPATRLPAALLVSIPALVALTAGLAAVGSDWAHPAYAEAALYLGLAALTVRTGGRDTPPAMTV